MFIANVYNLKRKNLILVATPKYNVYIRLTDDQNVDFMSRSVCMDLMDSYLNCLKLAKEYGLESIAFPSISTGIYHYPVEEVAEICARVVCSYKPKHLKQAYMCIYGDLSKIKTYNDAFLKYSKQDND